MNWSFYFDDDVHGDGKDQYITETVYPRGEDDPRWPFIDAEGVAEYAARYDYNEMDGWERKYGEVFYVNVVAPNGEVTKHKCWHVITVDHCTYPTDAYGEE